MWFWWFMFICDCITPVLLVVAGNLMWRHCPQKINGIYGYRTGRSMKNMDTWKFAHDYCGRLWWKMGWCMLIPSVLIQIPFYHSSETVIGIVGCVLCTIHIVALFISIFRTEGALKNTFSDDGIRKQSSG